MTDPPTWREFDDFRKEARDTYKALEMKLWGIIVALALLVIGSLYAQFAPHDGSAATTPPAALSNGTVLALDWMRAIVGGTEP